MSTGTLERPRSAVPLDGPEFDRLVLDFAVAAMAAALDGFGSLNSAILFAATARACGPFDQEPGRRRPVSINALASSLDRPFETTRRHANALVDQGLVTRTEEGLSVALAAIVDPRVARLVDRCHDRLVRLVAAARAEGFALPPTRADRPYDPRSGIGIALDLLLATVESHCAQEENFTRLALMLAVDWACRGDASSGVAMVRPARVARILGLPYATAARNLDTLVARGRLVRVGPGVAPVAEPAAAIDGRRALANRARQLLGRLAQTGFPMDTPAIAAIHPDMGFAGPV